MPRRPESSWMRRWPGCPKERDRCSCSMTWKATGTGRSRSARSDDGNDEGAAPQSENDPAAAWAADQKRDETMNDDRFQRLSEYLDDGLSPADRAAWNGTWSPMRSSGPSWQSSVPSSGRREVGHAPGTDLWPGSRSESSRIACSRLPRPGGPSDLHLTVPQFAAAMIARSGGKRAVWLTGRWPGSPTGSPPSRTRAPPTSTRLHGSRIRRRSRTWRSRTSSGAGGGRAASTLDSPHHRGEPRDDRPGDRNARSRWKPTRATCG